jgi:hypothetical protein
MFFEGGHAASSNRVGEYPKKTHVAPPAELRLSNWLESSNQGAAGGNLYAATRSGGAGALDFEGTNHPIFLA